MELNEKQEKGLEVAIKRYLDGEKCTTIAGYAGTGKAQPNDTLIPTPSGYKKLGELKIGDKVFDRLGKPTTVTGIFPQGEKEVYEVTFKDGRKTLCNDEHIFTVCTDKGEFVNKTVRQMLDSGLQKADKEWKFKIPKNEAVNYPEQKYDIDPYVIGCFLGDGCCKERQLTFSSNNEESVKEIAKLIGTDYKKNSKFNFNWTFPLKEPRYTIGEYGSRKYLVKKEQTKTLFKNYVDELCCGAESKRIPENYKRGSIEQRLSLVQGLLDTDGTISEGGGRFNIRFTSISIHLIKDLQEVVRSLGYEASISIDNRKEKYRTNVCYTLSINMPNEEKYLMFRLSTKRKIAEKAKAFHKRRDYSKIGIVDIQDLHYKTEMTCIMVDNKEHLYLTNDFIVTHNTSLVKFIINALNVNPDRVCYASFTGQAAEVLRKKGNSNAMTLHKLLYDTIPLPNGGFLRKPKLDIGYDIAVIDEVSMVPKTLMDLLFSHPCYVICLGDPFQLPPINKNEDNHLLDNPDIFLDQIMRQEEDSEIIRLSMNIREGKPIHYFNGKNVKVLPKTSVNTGMLTWADQILVATNKERIRYNNYVRSLLNKGPEPEDGDKVICLHNYWDNINTNGDPLINGTIGILRHPEARKVYFPRFIRPDNPSFDVINADIETEGGIYHNMNLDRKMILTGEKCCDGKISYQLGRLKPKIGERVPKEFAYGYAVTVHKAQGSQWDKVLVLEESFPFGRTEHARWLYTSITRAVDKVVLIR